VDEIAHFRSCEWSVDGGAGTSDRLFPLPQQQLAAESVVPQQQLRCPPHFTRADVTASPAHAPMGAEIWQPIVAISSSTIAWAA
jgi:hypothetical protein